MLLPLLRQTTPSDWPGLDTLYGDAFPDEELRPLVKDLLEFDRGILSILAEQEGAICGHVIFTMCPVGDEKAAVAALLGPLAVSPSQQCTGIGTALVREGFEQGKAASASIALVLGDPAYYGRFGFTAERRIDPPFPLPEEWTGAWQSVRLSGDGNAPIGPLQVPAPWDKKTYWQP
ncbi:putative acetyltransferase [Roseibium hamelinense]|uniref:Putative acetyltransferase n=1 Tax=Roseibium hamelinense TaxID=150831 RepID=A0A562T7Q7_9HYPH|nr:N-acetyltransferase [Roseibium hamelinense]MTI43517.1 N-acetyltransferase [Roseibium hamelinense]TWI89689.1 putative acetyltransferase [Roseibium hamelinense]